MKITVRFHSSRGLHLEDTKRILQNPSKCPRKVSLRYCDVQCQNRVNAHMLDMKDFRIEFDQANLVQSVLGILQALEIFCYFRRVQALAQLT